MAGKTVHAFISISASDCIANMPGGFGFPNNIPIVNQDDTQVIADNWADLLDGDIGVSLGAALTMPDPDYWWWSGSNADGTYDNSTYTNCDGWTSNSGSVRGINGTKNTSGSTWIHDGDQNGSVQYYVLGIAY